MKDTTTIFIAGIIFIVVILPLIDGLLQCISTLFEYFISFVSVHTMKSNVMIQDLKDSISQTNAQAIGFEAPLNYSDYDDEEEPDEDKISNKNKNKVGF